jgi:hypothetical protein
MKQRKFKYKKFAFLNKEYFILVFTDNGEVRLYDDSNVNRTGDEHRNSVMFSQQKRIITSKLLELNPNNLKPSIKQYIESNRRDSSQTTRTIGRALLDCLPGEARFEHVADSNTKKPLNENSEYRSIEHTTTLSSKYQHVDIDALERLSSLLQKEMITREEFDILKKKIITGEK